MSGSEFRALIANNQKWFDGVQNESPASIQAIESNLGFSLPESMKWILVNHGYTFSCGIDSLSSSAEITKRCREELGLPDSLLVINDWGDAGVVCLDSKNGKILWVGSHQLSSLASGEEPTDIDCYDGYEEWVLARLEQAKEEEEYA